MWRSRRGAVEIKMMCEEEEGEGEGIICSLYLYFRISVLIAVSSAF